MYQVSQTLNSKTKIIISIDYYQSFAVPIWWLHAFSIVTSHYQLLPVQILTVVDLQTFGLRGADLFHPFVDLYFCFGFIRVFVIWGLVVVLLEVCLLLLTFRLIFIFFWNWGFRILTLIFLVLSHKGLVSLSVLFFFSHNWKDYLMIVYHFFLICRRDSF